MKLYPVSFQSRIKNLEQNRATDYYECIPKQKTNKMEIQGRKYSKPFCKQTTLPELQRKPKLFTMQRNCVRCVEGLVETIQL